LIPLGDVIPSRTTPYLTFVIIGLNVLGWLFELSLSRDALRTLLQVYGVVPASFSAPALVSSMFLHGSWFHVVANMWCLWIFGDTVEGRLGHRRFVALYLQCGIVAALGQTAIDPTSLLPMIGASGAIAGVMGAYFVLYPRSRVLTLLPLIVFWDIVEIPAIVLPVVWLVVQFVSTGAIAVTTSAEGGGMALMGPVAGFAMGVVGVFAFRKRQCRDEYWT